MAKPSAENGNPRQEQVWPAWIQTITLLIIFGLLLGIGLWGTYASGHRTDQRLRQELLNEALAVTTAIPAEEALALTFTEADRDRPEFNRLTAQFEAYARIKGLHCLYTMALRDGRLFFGPGSLDPDHPQASPPGTEYLQPPPEKIAVFKTGEPVICSPSNDEYGPYYSACAPVFRPGTGEVLMAIGIDVAAETWQQKVRQARTGPLVITLAVQIILGITVVYAKLRPHHCRTRERGYHKIEAVSCSIIMLTLTIGISMLIRQMDKANRDELFDVLTQLKASAYIDEFHRIEETIKTLPVFFKASDFITETEFKEYCEGIIDSHSIAACAWVPQTFPSVEGEESTSESQATYPVLYIEPEGIHKQLLGRDLGVAPSLRSAIEATLEIQLSTAVFQTAETPYSRPGFVFFPARTPREQGVVTAILDPSELMRKAGIYNSYQLSGLSSTLMEIDSEGGLSDLIAPGQDGNHAELSVSGTALRSIAPVFAFGKTFALIIAPDRIWFEEHPLRNQPIALFSGIILTLLATGATFMMANRPLLLERLLRKHTEELVRSEERFDLAAAAAGIGVWEWDMTRDRMEWDDRMFALYGIDRNQFGGSMESCSKYMNPDDMKRLINEIKSIRNTGRKLDTTFRIIRPDNQVRHIRSFAIFTDQDSAAIRMVGINLDITDSKTKEEQIIAQLEELNRWQDVTMGREDRIIQLKREINALLAEYGQPDRYTQGLNLD